MVTPSDRLKTLRDQLRDLAFPRFDHVRIQWPDDGEEPSLCPYPLPSKLQFDHRLKRNQIALFARDIRIYDGWVTQHYVTGTQLEGADRFLLLADEGGRILKEQCPEELANVVKLNKERSTWLLALHELLAPDERFTWSERQPVFSGPIMHAREEPIPQCEIIKDVSLASIRAIDALLAASTPVPERPPEEPKKNAWTAYRLVKVVGMKQRDAADAMSKELGEPIKQYQVSRWCRQVAEFIQAGGILPDGYRPSGSDTGRGRTVSMDPGALEQIRPNSEPDTADREPESLG
jgi:hypothetical protein